jgi:hypothetical protein
MITTAEGTKQFHEDNIEGLNMSSQHIHRLRVVAEIYSRTATSDDAHDIVSLRCGNDLVWWVVETLGRGWMQNTERQMAIQNCIQSDCMDNDNAKGNLTGGGKDNSANTGKGNEPDRPDQFVEDYDNASEDDHSRVLEWFPRFSQK